MCQIRSDKQSYRIYLILQLYAKVAAARSPAAVATGLGYPVSVWATHLEFTRLMLETTAYTYNSQRTLLIHTARAMPAIAECQVQYKGILILQRAVFRGHGQR